MAEYIEKIRTDKGDKKINYDALANKPKIVAEVKNETLTIKVGKETEE